MAGSLAKRIGSPSLVPQGSDVRMKAVGQGNGNDGNHISAWQPMVDSGWASMALLMVWDMNSGPIKESEREYLNVCRKKLGIIKVGILKRSKILRGLKMVLDEGKGGRFAINQAALVMRAVSEKRMSEDECEFRMGVVRAHCENSIDSLIDEEIRRCRTLPISAEEMKAIKAMFEAARGCEDMVSKVPKDLSYLKEYAEIGKLATILTMSSYHPMAKDNERKEQVVKTMTILEEAKSRFAMTIGGY